MSLEIAWKQNILVTDSNLLKSLLVVFGFGSQAFICGFSRQNICSAFKYLYKINMICVTPSYCYYNMYSKNLSFPWFVLHYTIWYIKIKVFRKLHLNSDTTASSNDFSLARYLEVLDWKFLMKDKNAVEISLKIEPIVFCIYYCIWNHFCPSPETQKCE